MKLNFSFMKGGLLLLLMPLLVFAHGISEADKQRMLDGGYMQYVGLGASHMLTGYDHLLFLLGRHQKFGPCLTESRQELTFT